MYHHSITCAHTSNVPLSNYNHSCYIYIPTYLAVIAVLGVIMACSMVFGREPWVPGRMNPERGLPDWDSGLIPWLIPRLAVPGGLRSDVPGPEILYHRLYINL